MPPFGRKLDANVGHHFGPFRMPRSWDQISRAFSVRAAVPFFHCFWLWRNNKRAEQQNSVVICAKVGAKRANLLCVFRFHRSITFSFCLVYVYYIRGTHDSSFYIYFPRRGLSLSLSCVLSRIFNCYPTTTLTPQYRPAASCLGFCT